ncbi:MAG: hypothetical protein JWP12_1928 [Bacteroidetes bacterium]|nr:hypothetical protein [Bacteroidota bacterium]
MRNSVFLFFCSIFLLIANSAFSQATINKDTVILLNGDEVICSVIDTTDGVTSIKNPKNPRKNIIIENDRIFSIKNEKGESIMYVYDTVIGNEFTVDEMRYFIYGEKDADKNFKANGCLALGAAVGILSGLSGSFLCPIPPFAFTVLSGLPKIKIKHETVTNLDWLTHEPYLMGYERVARKKRKIKSLIGGGAGLLIGLGTFGVLQSSGNATW